MRPTSLLSWTGAAVAGLLGMSTLSCRPADAAGRPGAPSATSDRQPVTVPAAPAGQAVATFAGGCFWSMQKAFDGVPGVIDVVAGYAGGTKANPTYEDVETGETGHAESVRVTYDSARINYARLLDVYWHHIDPLTLNSAFCDYGPQYRSIIFYHDAAQRRVVQAGARRVSPLQEPDRHHDRGGHAVLSGGSVPPAILQDESRALRGLPDWLPAGRSAP